MKASSTTPAYDDLMDRLSGADGQKELVEWISNPLTGAILLAARELARPGKVFPGETAEGKLGESIGANSIVDFLLNPSLGEILGNKEMPLPTYGAKAILEETK